MSAMPVVILQKSYYVDLVLKKDLLLLLLFIIVSSPKKHHFQKIINFSLKSLKEHILKNIDIQTVAGCHWLP